MKAKLLLACIVIILVGYMSACTPKYRYNDYRGYYRDHDHKEHHYTTKPHRDRD